MYKFSLVHREHIPETGEKGLALLTFSHLIECVMFFFFNLFMCFERDVWFASGFLNEVLWVPNLALKVVLVRPI